jgi:uncharacterized protein
MAERIFVDTGGFYALVIESDDAHQAMIAALGSVRAGKSRWVTTDYVLDETATLLMARGHPHLAEELLGLVDRSRALELEWMDSDRFLRTRSLFSRYCDQRASFTDCFSFVTMRELRIRAVLSKDRHFEAAGFERRLP